MKTSKSLVITALIFTLSTSNLAFSKDISKINVAVVDVQKILESSPQLSALNVDRKNKVGNLVSFTEKAKTDIAKETNATKKKILEDNYTKEINSRKEALDKDYIQNLSSVGKEISTLINSKTTNYDLVLTKSSVLNGGTDITNEIIKELK